MPPERMPLATRKRALELGATFIENDLGEMRAKAQRADERGVGDDKNGGVYPITHCFEHDLMKVAEWASAAATLRALAAAETGEQR